MNRFKLRADNELILISRHSTYNPIISSQVAVLVLVVDIILADSAERYEYAPPASYQPEKEVKLLSTEYVPIALSSIYNKWDTMRLLRETKEIKFFFCRRKDHTTSNTTSRTTTPALILVITRNPTATPCVDHTPYSFPTDANRR